MMDLKINGHKEHDLSQKEVDVLQGIEEHLKSMSGESPRKLDGDWYAVLGELRQDSVVMRSQTAPTRWYLCQIDCLKHWVGGYRFVAMPLKACHKLGQLPKSLTPS